MNAYLLCQLPLLAGFALLLVSASVWPKQDRFSQPITVAALALAALFTLRYLTPGDEFFGGAIRVTLIGQALAYGALALMLLAVLLSQDYLAKIRVRGMEFRMVILAQALGLFHLPLAGDLATLFIAFELVSIPSYVLAGFNHRDRRANEAGMKYLVLGAFASALFLLGIAFLYGATGETHLSDIQRKIAGYILNGAASEADLVLAKASLAFLLAAMLFKTGTAPFHFWLSDVYAGTNLSSLAFLAAPAKVVFFGLIALLLWGPFAYLYETWQPVLLLAAFLCAVFGNVQAIAQTKLKRLLAYSSVANAGFILLSLFLQSAGAFLFYLMAYGITVLGLIAAFMALGTRTADLEDVDDLKGLGRRHPWIAGALTLMLFSLAGIPLTAGFAAKFAVASEAFVPGAELLRGYVPVLAISVALGLVSFFFYFKLVRALWMSPAEEGEASEPRSLGWSALFVTGFCALAVLVLGVLMRLPGMPIG